MLLAIYYNGLIFLLKKLMKKTILTTSILALFASSLTFAATDITSGGTYNTYTDNADMGKILLNGAHKDSNPADIPQEIITNSDFSGSTFNAGDKPAILIYSNTKLTNTSFKGTTFKTGNNYVIFVDGRWEDKVRPIVENVDFSGSTIIKCTSSTLLVALRIGFITGNPNEMLGTKTPSITSMCTHSAALRSIIFVSRSRLPKSADNIEGEIIRVIV